MPGFFHHFTRATRRLPQWKEIGRVTVSSSMPDASEDEVRKRVRQLERTHWRIVFEHLWLWFRSPRHEFVNLERFREQAKDGAILAACHFGAFFSLPTECGRLGYHLRVFLAPQLLEALGALFRRLGRRHDIDLQLLDASQPRRMLQALRESGPGTLMVILADGNIAASDQMPSRDHLAELELHGIRMFRRTSVAYLAARSGLPVIPACESFEGCQRRIVFGEALPAPESRDPEVLQDFTVEMFRRLEEIQSEQPLLWEGWFHPHLYWHETNPGPAASAGDFQRERARLEGAWMSPDRSMRAYSDPYRVGAFYLEDHAYLIEAAEKRLMPVNADTVRLLRAARKRPALRKLVKKAKCEPEQALETLTRLSLAGYVSFEPA